MTLHAKLKHYVSFWMIHCRTLELLSFCQVNTPMFHYQPQRGFLAKLLILTSNTNNMSNELRKMLLLHLVTFLNFCDSWHLCWWWWWRWYDDTDVSSRINCQINCLKHFFFLIKVNKSLLFHLWRMENSLTFAYFSIHRERKITSMVI